MKMFDLNTRTIRATHDQMMASITDINWDQIARHVGTRSKLECKKRWTVAQHPFINNRPFLKDELELLEQVIAANGDADWVSIARMHGHGRVAIQCFKAYRTLIRPPNIGVNWTTAEDMKLLAAIDSCSPNDWLAVSQHLNGRSAKQCLQRYKFVVAPGKKKGRWNATEDETLLKAVQEFGRGKWNHIAAAVGTRTDMQCRERYENCLNPEICLKPFTPEEENILSAAVLEHGIGKWSRISRCFVNRTDNSCRRTWNAMEKRLELKASSEEAALKEAALESVAIDVVPISTEGDVDNTLLTADATGDVGAEINLDASLRPTRRAAKRKVRAAVNAGQNLTECAEVLATDGEAIDLQAALEGSDLIYEVEGVTNSNSSNGGTVSKKSKAKRPQKPTKSRESPKAKKPRAKRQPKEKVSSNLSPVASSSVLNAIPVDTTASLDAPVPPFQRRRGPGRPKKLKL
ncbi:hypothetical protein BASA61_009348 [Batrachochytrium salamandrivorans]|nr:hypothetical protein BASA60_011376 [Batrachochytrium salamandrivorans]KAH6575568.1 hypothetical protein BASA62_001838 [Batrachochytrium salamandrivorans]KAH6580893.1 hypothetical protein BASA61_009348 [Batrachochytrium salamandrivorans]